jgi:ribonuclease HII
MNEKKASVVLQSVFKDDSKVEAGLDEAGRGCFWGPIMAGAVIWPHESEWTDAHRKLMPNIKDSKKIAPKKRMVIAEDIKKLAKAWGVGSVSAKEIDEKGITWANQEAFRRAIAELSLKPDRIIIDGTLNLTEFEGEKHTIVDGDATYLSIAAASILAKTTHDIWIQEYCEECPELNERYSMLSCHGYGTEKHRNGLRTYGAHELHRCTFIHNWIPGSPEKEVSSKCTINHKSEVKCLIKFK